MKKSLGLLSILVVTIVFAACTKPVEEKVTLSYWGVFEPTENLTELIAEYQSKNPNVTIKYVRKSLKDYRQQIEARVGQSNGPDLVRYHNSWVPELKGYLATSPQSTVDALNYDKTFYPVAIRDLKVGRGYYGIPLMYDGLELYYNKSIFERVGILKPPAEWGDILETANQLKSPKTGTLDIAGIALGSTKNVDYWPDIMSLLMLQNNASLANPFVTKENSETAINFYKQQLKDGLWSEAFPNSTESFAQGKVAMIFGVSWTAFEIQQKNPSLQFAAVPVPQLPGSKIGIASYWVEGVANNISTTKQEEGWKFLTYLAQQENQQRLHAIQAKTRLFGEPYSRKDLADELTNNEYLSAILDTAEESQSWYMSDRTFGGGINDELKTTYEKLVSDTKGIERYSKDIQATLKKYGMPVK
ncbi:MAG: extracellular solute-binding protein [bacterium]|nr:extracellular solute-binding protein [bacterium]